MSGEIADSAGVGLRAERSAESQFRSPMHRCAAGVRCAFVQARAAKFCCAACAGERNRSGVEHFFSCRRRQSNSRNIEIVVAAAG
jgi:hypothetical protein